MPLLSIICVLSSLEETGNKTLEEFFVVFSFVPYASSARRCVLAHLQEVVGIILNDDNVYLSSVRAMTP